MFTELIGTKQTKSYIGLTKARIVPDHIILLSNPLENIKIEFEEESKNGNIDKLLYKNKRIKIDNMIISNILPMTSKEKREERNRKRYENNIKKLDIGYLIPINIDENKKKLSNFTEDNCYKITNKIDKNYFIYQLINNEVYVLVSVINNYFINNKKQEQIDLFNSINDKLEYFSNNFKNEIKNIKPNSRHTYSIYGGTEVMQGHHKYAIPTLTEKYCHAAGYIQDYINKYNYDYDFKFIKNNDKKIYSDFIENKNLDYKIDIKLCHFNDILKEKTNTFEFYNYLNTILFPLIIKLESYIANLIKNSFPDLYLDFNINLPTIQTKLSFFKSFGINFSIGESDYKIRCY